MLTRNKIALITASKNNIKNFLSGTILENRFRKSIMIISDIDDQGLSLMFGISKGSEKFDVCKKNWGLEAWSLNFLCLAFLGSTQH